MMEKVTYLAVFEPCSTGYRACFPDLPGCAASGPDIETALVLAKEALSAHYSSMAGDGDPVPDPSPVIREETIKGAIVLPVTIDLV